GSARLPERTRQEMGSHMHGADPPEHARLRRPVARVLTVHRLRKLEGPIRRAASGLLRRMVDEADGRTADLLSSFAFPLPLTMLCELLGLPLADRELLRRWTGTLSGGSAGQPEMLTATAELQGYIRERLAAKRACPGGDLLSELVAPQPAAHRLTEHELVSTVFLLIVAGFETTAHLIGNVSYLLLTRPELHDPLRREPGLVAGAVE